MHDALGQVAKRRLADPLPQAMGRLWAREWRENERPIAAILQKLKDPGTFGGKAQLHAAGELLAAHPHEIDVATALLALPVAYRWEWVLRLLPAVFDAPESPSGALLWRTLRENAPGRHGTGTGATTSDSCCASRCIVRSSRHRS